MRPSFVVSLVLLCLFLTKIQGIRLEKGSFAAQQHKQQDEESNLLKGNNSGKEEAILCKDEQCTGKIKSRKLFTTSASASYAISKNVKTKGNEAHDTPVNGNTRSDSVNGKEEEKKVNKQQEELPHEDLVNIIDMDYSPARRKTPIHN